MEGVFLNFINKTAISTGAASGMGLLYAQNFADLGGNIMIDGGRNSMGRWN